MSKRMYEVKCKKSKKEKMKMTINTNELQLKSAGKLNRNDGIVKSGTGVWENKKRKNINKIYKKEMSEYHRIINLIIV